MTNIMRKLSKIPDYLKYETSDFMEMIRYFTTGKSRSMFNLKAYHLGFAEHQLKSPGPNGDREIIQRLIRAYRTAKKDEQSAPEPYRLRGEWEHIINAEYARLVDALKKEDEEALQRLLRNFCRNECSRGLGMSSNYLAAKYRPLFKFSYIDSFRKEHDNWQLSEMGSFRPCDFHYPFVGNPVGMMVEQRVIPIVSLRHHYYAKRLLHLNNNAGAVFAEIGGGFGGLAYFLLKNASAPIHYMNFDLPEINVVNAYFLIKAFPEKKILLYGEGAALGEASASADAVIYPHYTFPQIGDRSVDVVFNSNSLSEMDEAMVLEYFRQISRICRGYFLHANHDDEKVYDKKLNKRHVPLSQYSLPPDQFETIVYKKPTFYHPKYFEYLYKSI